VETKKAVTTWTLGTTIDSQQVGNAWTGGDDLVSLSMSGDLNVFDKRVGDRPSRILKVRYPSLSSSFEELLAHILLLSKAPVKAITAATKTHAGPTTFISGLSDGRVLSFTGSEYDYVSGEGHKTLVSALGTAPDGKVFSIGYDDVLREVTADGSSFVYVSRSRQHLNMCELIDVIVVFCT
jgi:WD repeat-containing protein 1 (actin-interacting protein 1)